MAKDIFFISSLCLIPFSVVQAEHVGLSECGGGSCNDYLDDALCNVSVGIKIISQNSNAECGVTVPVSCSDYLDTVNIKFEIDTEDGATFEKYVNIDNSSEVGYRSCTDECSITIAGKCKAPSNSDEPTATPTPTVTVPEPEPDTTSTPEPVCNYYRGNMYYWGYEPIKSVYSPVRYYNGAGNLSCLTSLVNHVSNIGFQGYGACPWTGYYDDCVAVRLTDIFFGYYDYTGVRANGSYCAWYDRDLIHRSGENACGWGEFYLDKNCNVIHKPENGVECGYFDINYVRSSPIPLVFEKDFDINSDLAFVNFNLDPANQDSWYTWKASNKAPLLVYDPEHNGIINSAYQLFGEWTFGGKQSASLPLQENFTPSSKWENGFEALASLDRDFDGKLTGEELNELALWFDGNRDAISQEGEVMSLADAGVTTLYVNGYKKDVNGDLRLDLGYERKLGDDVIQGASIDWYGKGADSKRALVESYSATFMKPNLVNQNTPTQQVEKKNEAVKVNVKPIDVSEFRGIWDYFVDGEDKYETPDGYLVLGEGEEPNSISGHSLSETIFTKSSDIKKRYSHVGMFKLTGHAGMSAKNEKIISFSIQGKNMVNESRAMLSADKKTLIGTTSLVLNGGVKVATYNWKAVRQEMK